MEPPAKQARHGEVSSSAVDEALNSRVPAMGGWLPPVIMQCFGPNANVLTNVLWLDDDGSIAPAPTKKYVKHQAFKKKLSNMCPQVRGTGIGHKTSSFCLPDHGACGRASIALRRARKVCTLCAARALSRFYFL